VSLNRNIEVECHKFCVGCRYDAVEEELHCEEVYCGSSAVTWVVDEVATHGDACPKLVLLCITVRAYYSAVGDVPPAFFWDLCFVVKKDGFCGGYEVCNFLAE
jgi:hypothetical protein